MSQSVSTPSNRAMLYSSGLDPAFGRLFDQAFRDFFSTADNAQSLRKLAMDVTETDTGYVVHADLPGIDKDAVKISIDGARVTISAETKAGTENTGESGKVIYRERSSAQYYRAFELPAELDAAAADAKLDGGVLTLTLPRKAQTGVQQITVK